VVSLEIIPAGADIGFAMYIWSDAGAVGDPSPRTQPRVTMATAVAKAIGPVYFHIVVSLASGTLLLGRLST
jgi:hypothetical protein